MNDTAIQTILKYVEINLFEPGCTWPTIYFEERSYARWAAIEILESIMNHPFRSADEIIEEFIFKMIIYSAWMDNPDICFRFSVAKETAENILEIL